MFDLVWKLLLLVALVIIIVKRAGIVALFAKSNIKMLLKPNYSLFWDMYNMPNILHPCHIHN